VKVTIDVGPYTAMMVVGIVGLAMLYVIVRGLLSGYREHKELWIMVIWGMIGLTVVAGGVIIAVATVYSTTRV